MRRHIPAALGTCCAWAAPISFAVPEPARGIGCVRSDDGSWSHPRSRGDILPPGWQRQGPPPAPPWDGSSPCSVTPNATSELASDSALSFRDVSGAFCRPPPPLGGERDIVLAAWAGRCRGRVPRPWAAAVMRPVDVRSPASKRWLPGCRPAPGAFGLFHTELQSRTKTTGFEVVLANGLKNILQWPWKKKTITFDKYFGLISPLSFRSSTALLGRLHLVLLARAECPCSRLPSAQQTGLAV